MHFGMHQVVQKVQVLPSAGSPEGTDSPEGSSPPSESSIGGVLEVVEDLRERRISSKRSALTVRRSVPSSSVSPRSGDEGIS